MYSCTLLEKKPKADNILSLGWGFTVITLIIPLFLKCFCCSIVENCSHFCQLELSHEIRYGHHVLRCFVSST
jgi:hypothetical protein